MQDALIIELKNVQSIFRPDYNKNYGQLKLSAGSNYLLLNYEFFDKIECFLICGFNQHIHKNRRKCIANENQHFTLSFQSIYTEKQDVHSCNLNVDYLMNLNYIERSKLNFICYFMSN
jgi:hypothetical protein